MSYSNIEILAGVLVAACILLLYCNYTKSKSEGMRHGGHLPGLYMKDAAEGMYSDLPRSGSFGLSYTTKSGHFEEDMTTGLNEQVSQPTPASNSVQAPCGNENELLWTPDASIALDVYNSCGLNSHQFSAIDEAHMIDTIFHRKTNQNSVHGPASLCGTSMKYIDFGGNMQPTRAVTM